MLRAAVVLILLLTWPVAAAPQRHGGPPVTPTGTQQGAKPAAVPAKDQRPNFKPWWQDEKTISELHLSGEQSAKIEAIWQSVRPRLQATFEDVNRAEQQMAKLIAANETTEIDVVRQLTQVQAARNEADRQRTLMLFKMQRELTPDQRVKFKAMRDKWEQDRHEGRRTSEPTRLPQPPTGQTQKKK